MIYGSVCSGIEAATVAWHTLGWKPAFFSEIEKAPREVLQYRYPDVSLHGDFTTIKEEEYGPIDLLVGGTPCQAFSVAGLRKGLSDERGNLTLEFIRLAERTKPRWVVWENVPGVLSIDKGRAFGSFLGGLAQCGYGFSYRVLDAQYFGVPQRRRRVFVVGYLGDWRPAAAVLFERESLRGDITPRREAGEDVAGTIGARTCRSVGAQDADLGHLIQENGGNRHPGIHLPEMSGSKQLDMVADMRMVRPRAEWPAKTAPTLNASFGDKQGLENQHALNGAGLFVSSCYPINTQIAMRHKSLGGGTGMGIGKNNDPSFTLMKNHSHAVDCFCPNQITSKTNRSNPTSELCHTLPASQSPPIGFVGMQVRRLTPRECERLQGFPDDYTLVPLKLKPRQTRVRYMADGPRYKMLGNSMAVPVMHWIGHRIQMVDDLIKGGLKQ